jgi:hypothetical protein
MKILHNVEIEDEILINLEFKCRYKGCSCHLSYINYHIKNGEYYQVVGKVISNSIPHYSVTCGIGFLFFFSPNHIQLVKKL